MGLGEFIINAIMKCRVRKLKSARSAHGSFYRDGGTELLYDVPVTTGSLVIDAGGFKGEWTASMIARYGCRSEVFEPIPSHFDHCKQLFTKNRLVRVHASALGGSSRIANFSYAVNGSSEFIAIKGQAAIEAPVMDVSTLFDRLGGESVACIKLNIEGGEYEVLERLITTNQITRCKSLLIQFHSQPEDWEQRMKDIEARLWVTHKREWCYPMVWEKWIRLDKASDLKSSCR